MPCRWRACVIRPRGARDSGARARGGRLSVFPPLNTIYLCKMKSPTPKTLRPWQVSTYGSEARAGNHTHYLPFCIVILSHTFLELLKDSQLCFNEPKAGNNIVQILCYSTYRLIFIVFSFFSIFSLLEYFFYS